ncbi:hypothetical protein D9M68_609580 [compost metagenome]
MDNLAVMAWMLMLAIYPNSDRRRGFTLLELLVVLALVAAVAALALPALMNMQASWARRIAAEDLNGQLQSLGFRARASGREVEICAAGIDPPEMLEVPDGWVLTADPPVRYLANGACLGGKLQVLHEGVVREVTLTPPFCNPQGLL